MPEKPLINPATRTAIESYIKHPNMPLLITGGPGSGKLDVARAVSAELLGLEVSQLTSSASYHFIGSADVGEGIETIRQAIKRLSLKNVSNSDQPRVLLISKADQLSIEAQNTLLKTLEEPSTGSVIIMTSSSASSILPTVISRCTLLSTHPVSIEDSLRHYTADFSTTDITSAWNLANGSVGLLDDLLKIGSQHPLRNAVNDAKKFLAMPRFEKIIFIEKKASARDELRLLLTAISLVLGSAHRLSLAKNRNDKKKIFYNRKLVQALLAKLDNNANAKLTGLQLALNLKV